MEFLNHNTKPTNMSWFEYIQKRCDILPTKKYESKALTDVEIKKVYRNDFFRQDSSAYFEDREDKITAEYKRLKKEGIFNGNTI